MSGFSEIWNPGCWRGGWGVGVGVRRFSLTSWSWLRHWQTLSSIQASLQSPTWTGQFRHHARSVSCKLFRLWRDCVTTKKVPSPRPSLSLFDVRLLSYSRNKSRIGRRIYGAKELKTWENFLRSKNFASLASYKMLPGGWRGVRVG